MKTTDEVIQATFLSPDDKAWKREQRRKRQKMPPPPEPIGECCGTCSNWRSPYSGEKFGECRRLRVMAAYVPRAPERGSVVSLEDAMMAGWPTDALRTTNGFAACSRYAEKEQKAA